MEYAIETFSLTKIFSDWWGRSKVRAVDELDLQIRHNEVYGLLGPNGSGKTTAIKMLLGLLHPTKGKSLVLGGDSTNPKISARIGFMPEDSYLYRYLNARETLDFYGRLFSLPSKVRKTRIEALLDMVGLTAVASRPVGTFSKGMARRIGLAQALINDPDLLILDEPTTGLDPIGTKQIKDLIIELSKRGKTILLCSHLLADVEDVCDRIAILYGGKIQTQGEVSNLLQQTNKIQITANSISAPALERIKRILSKEQADFDICSPMDRLETFFIKTVAEAQMQGKSTSGAVSTSSTQISDFLAAQDTDESRRKNILDKLVSSSSSGKSSEQKGAVTEKVSQADQGKPGPDEQLLSKLTSTNAPTETTSVLQDAAKTEPVTPQQDQEKEADKNVLDQLTNPSSSENDKENTRDE